jgi:4,5-dihydroxyphthalate decarboxylase
MADIPITVASGDYDRIRALRDGRVTVEGCAVTYSVVEANQLFARNLRSQEFDVAEMSFSTYIALRAAGRAHYTATPVFLSRAFRHSAIFVRTDRGIASPADLKGRRVGTPEYFTTMLVWMRGLLADEYGVEPADLRWRIGGMEEPAKPPPNPPPNSGEDKVGAPPTSGPPSPNPLPASGEGRVGAGIEIEPIAPDKTLAGMLADGEIDALFSARPPSCFLRGAPHVARLFPDYRPVEQAYYRRTGIYPLMHAVGIRNSLVESYPWLAKRLYDAYARAKDIALADLGKLAAFAVTLPWIEAEYRATQAVLGGDVWPYGIAANRKAFTARRMQADELFAPMA